ncbi:MAG: THxN family PEP-CTERM protein [Thainema sp.]
MVNYLKKHSTSGVSSILGTLSIAASIAASLTGLGGSFAAEAIPLTSVSGTWSDPQDGTDILYVEQDGASQIFWGEARFEQLGQSGLSFLGNQNIEIETEEAFRVGQLTHFNMPVITGTAVSAVDLTISLILGDISQSNAFEFVFSIEETPNGTVEECPYIGIPPCPDRISWTSLTSSDTITIDGQAYILELLGFQDPVTGAYEDGFISQEGSSNQSLLYGQLVLAPPSRSVPEPGIWMGLASVAAYGVYRWRRS